LPKRSSRRSRRPASKLEIIPGDGKQTLTKYRARTHDIYIGTWGGLLGPAHQRRHLHAQPEQRRRRQEQDAGLAQRLGHPGTDRRRAAALLERDGDKRAAMYEDCSRPTSGKSSPFVMLFQQTEVAGLSQQREGLQARAGASTRSATLIVRLLPLPAKELSQG
jgi:hypothetical protein